MISCIGNSKNKVIADGKYDGTKRIGQWKYSTGNTLDSIVEYVCYKGGYNVGQKWILNKEKDTIGGHYYESSLDDTISLPDKNRIYFFLREPLFKKSLKRVYLLIPNNTNIVLDSCLENKDYYNYDTVLSLKDRFKNKNLYQDRVKDVVLDYETKNKGDHEFRGILVEEYETIDGGIDGYEFFVNLPFYVK